MHGWSEGPWQSRKFRAVLKDRKLEITKDAVKSDIVVAHSFGCYLVPRETKAKVVMLIGIPHWPKRSYFASAWINSHEGFYHHHKEGELEWWIAKLAHNLWYTVSRPKMTYDLLTKHNAKNLVKAGPGRNVLLIRNHADAFCHPNVQEILPATSRYKLVEMPGGHEDCWVNPKPYVDLLLKEI